jgi:hypothetical protein
MPAIEYDFSDEDIRRLVEINHRPVEPTPLIQSNGAEVHYSPGNKIRCERDGQEWPCKVVKALREWQRGMGADRQTL